VAAAGAGRSRRVSIPGVAEHARLALRRLGIVIDRGRLVREAIAVLLADLDARGRDSLLARRTEVSDSLPDGEPGSP
jgi:hypothetical protein